MTTIEIFKKMYDWLCVNKGIVNQVDVARAAGLNEVTVSRILNGQVKKASQETLLKVNAAYGNVFNPEWMRGESDVMLVADLHDVNHDGLPTPPDSSMTAALLASKDETIAALRAQLAQMERTITTKDDVIAAKDEVIASKDAHISTLQQQITDLRAKLATEKGLLTSGISLSELADNRARAHQNP